MAQESFPPWIAMIVGFVPGATTAAVAWFRFRTERSDKHTETVTELRDRVRSTMDAQSLAMYDRLERENKRLAERLDELESDKIEVARDRDRGWYLARWWEGYAHDIKHTFANLLFRANGRLELAKIEPIQVPEIHWPTLEEPMPKQRENKPDA